MVVAATLLALYAFPSVGYSQEETVSVLDVGRVTYSLEIVKSEPDLERLQGLVQQVSSYISMRCQCAAGTPMDVGWSFEVLPYAEFEEFVLEILDQSGPRRASMAEAIRGDRGIVEGLTINRGGNPATFFFQWPSDSLLVHELMHVAFPFDTENQITRKQTEFLTNRYYKDWLARNH